MWGLASSTPGLHKYTFTHHRARTAVRRTPSPPTEPRRTGTRAQPQGQATGMRHRTAWSAPSDVRAGTSCKCNGSSGGLARRSTNLGRRTANAPGAQPAHRPRTARARAPPGRGAHRRRNSRRGPAERVFDHRRRYRGTTSRRRGSRRFPRVYKRSPGPGPPHRPARPVGVRAAARSRTTGHTTPSRGPGAPVPQGAWRALVEAVPAPGPSMCRGSPGARGGAGVPRGTSVRIRSYTTFLRFVCRRSTLDAPPVEFTLHAVPRGTSAKALRPVVAPRGTRRAARTATAAAVPVAPPRAGPGPGARPPGPMARMADAARRRPGVRCTRGSRTRIVYRTPIDQYEV